MQSNIDKSIYKHFEPLSEEDRLLVAPLLEKQVLPAGYRLLEEGIICYYLYFLQEGLVRCHTRDERTVWYEFEENAFTSLESFYGQQPSGECITLMENCILYRISYQNLMALFEQSHSWAKWGLRFYQRELSRIEGYYKQLLYKDATTRYQELIAARPDILQRIPLHHIASYLGITTVSLSRIRAGKQRKRI